MAKMNILKLFKMIIFIIILGLIIKVLAFSFDDRNTYSRVMLHDFYEADENINMVFLGASHVYLGLNPFLVEKNLDVSAFSLGSASQDLIDTYYLTKEVLESKKVDTIFIEITYRGYLEKEKSDFASRIIFNYFELSKNKADYCYDAFGVPLLFEKPSFIINNQKRILDGIKSLAPIEKLEDTNYINYNHFQSDIGDYLGNGFVYSHIERDRDIVLDNDKPLWDPEKIDLERVSYLKSIIEMAKENDVEVILYSIPYHPSHLLNNPESSNASKYFQNIAKEFGIPYFDYNLAKSEYLNLEFKNYHDSSHLNGSGATIFTKCLIDTYKEYKENKDTSYRFYNNFNARKEELIGVQGLNINTDISVENKELSIHVKPIIAKQTGVIKYAFTISKDSEIIYQRDYEDDNNLLWKYSESGNYRIEVFAKEMDREINFSAMGGKEVYLKTNIYEY